MPELSRFRQIATVNSSSGQAYYIQYGLAPNSSVGYVQAVPHGGGQAIVLKETEQYSPDQFSISSGDLQRLLEEKGIQSRVDSRQVESSGGTSVYEAPQYSEYSASGSKQSYSDWLKGKIAEETGKNVVGLSKTSEGKVTGYSYRESESLESFKQRRENAFQNNYVSPSSLKKEIETKQVFKDVQVFGMQPTPAYPRASIQGTQFFYQGSKTGLRISPEEELKARAQLTGESDKRKEAREFFGLSDDSIKNPSVEQIETQVDIVIRGEKKTYGFMPFGGVGATSVKTFGELTGAVISIGGAELVGQEVYQRTGNPYVATIAGVVGGASSPFIASKAIKQFRFFGQDELLASDIFDVPSLKAGSKGKNIYPQSPGGVPQMIQRFESGTAKVKGEKLFPELNDSKTIVVHASPAEFTTEFTVKAQASKANDALGLFNAPYGRASVPFLKLSRGNGLEFGVSDVFAQPGAAVIGLSEKVSRIPKKYRGNVQQAADFFLEEKPTRLGRAFTSPSSELLGKKETESIIYPGSKIIPSKSNYVTRVNGELVSIRSFKAIKGKGKNKTNALFSLNESNRRYFKSKGKTPLVFKSYEGLSSHSSYSKSSPKAFFSRVSSSGKGSKARSVLYSSFYGRDFQESLKPVKPSRNSILSNNYTPQPRIPNYTIPEREPNPTPSRQNPLESKPYSYPTKYAPPSTPPSKTPPTYPPTLTPPKTPPRKRKSERFEPFKQFSKTLGFIPLVKKRGKFRQVGGKGKVYSKSEATLLGLKNTLKSSSRTFTIAPSRTLIEEKQEGTVAIPLNIFKVKKGKTGTLFVQRTGKTILGKSEYKDIRFPTDKTVKPLGKRRKNELL